MLRKPLDLFDEMDGMFARIFARVDREFMDNVTSGPVYRMKMRAGRTGTPRNQPGPRLLPVNLQWRSTVPATR